MCTATATSVNRRGKEARGGGGGLIVKKKKRRRRSCCTSFGQSEKLITCSKPAEHGICLDDPAQHL